MVADTVADKGYIHKVLRRRIFQEAFSFKVFICGGKGIRTPDPLHAMQVLYQLSYTPEGTSMLSVLG